MFPVLAGLEPDMFLFVSQGLGLFANKDMEGVSFQLFYSLSFSYDADNQYKVQCIVISDYKSGLFCGVNRAVW